MEKKRMEQANPLEETDNVIDETLRSYYRQEKEASLSAELWESVFASIPAPKHQELPIVQEPRWPRWVRRFQGSLRWPWFFLPLGAAATTTAALLLFVLRPAPSDVSLRPLSVLHTSPEEGTPKGSLVSLTLFYSRKTKDGFLHKEHAKPGEILYEGDLIQLAYESPRPLHLMVLSLHAKGEVSLVVPFGKQESLPISKGRGFFPEEGSLALDEYIGPEIFLFLVAETAFSLASAQQAISKAYQAAKHNVRLIRTIPGPWSSHSLAIEKQAPHPHP